MKNQYRDKFLKLALETGIINVQEGKEGTLDVTFDRTFQGNAHALRQATCACREFLQDPINGLYAAVDVLFSFDDVIYNLPFVAVAAQEFEGGDAKLFAHHDMYRDYDRSFLKGKRVVIITIDDEDLAYPGAFEFINEKYDGHLTAFVTLFSRRKDEPELGVPVIRLLTEEYVTQQTLVAVG